MASLSTSELKKSISAILRGADLNTLSSKKVRKKLEEQYDTDFSERKEEIDTIVMAMVTAEGNDQKSESEEAESEDEKNSDQESLPQNSESEEEKEPPPKKSKPAAKNKPKKEVKNDVDTKSDSPSEKSEDDADLDDEALARKLQEEERNSRSRAVKKNVAKKETSKRSRKNNENPKVRKESTYTRKCVLSDDLASVVGANEMARHDVVKKMWSIVRERNLFDPRNKQFAICDEQLLKVFGKKRVRVFGMMKYLKNHIKDPN